MFIPGRAGSTSIYPSDLVTDSLTFPLADEVNIYKRNVSGDWIANFYLPQHGIFSGIIHFSLAKLSDQILLTK